MHIEVSQDHYGLIQNKIDSGLYPSQEVFIARAVTLQDIYDRKLAALRSEIQLGINDIASGNFSEYNPDEIIQEIEKLKPQN